MLSGSSIMAIRAELTANQSVLGSLYDSFCLNQLLNDTAKQLIR